MADFITTQAQYNFFYHNKLLLVMVWQKTAAVNGRNCANMVVNCSAAVQTEGNLI